MNMKTKYILLLFILFSGTVGCDKFINLNSPNDLTLSIYFKTPDQILSAVNGSYATLRADGITKNLYVFGEIPSDNSSNALSGTVTDQDEFDKFYIRTTNPFLSGFWNDHYKGISKVNLVLASLDAVDMDAALKSQYRMEMEFLRAYLYFDLVRVFGDVPLVTVPITNIQDSYKMGRDHKADVYAQIIKDLTDAEGLPQSYTGSDIGRATKGSAKALLGKVYLTLNDYANAETKLKEIIDLNQYALLENATGSLNINGYVSVFDPNNHNNKESVFEVQFKKGGFGTGSNFVNNFAPENSGTSVASVGGTSGNNIPSLDMWNNYEQGDLRRDFSMALTYVNSQGATVNSRYVWKYRDTPYQNNDANNDFPSIRYADVLLMYSECLNENGKTAEACNYLNKIRRRGFGYQTNEVSPMDVNTSDKIQYRLLVEHERRVELAFECTRWFDLIRTGRAVEVMTSKGFKLDETNLICPIPQIEIDINPSVITQNEYHYH
jgi:tetratricopeptide (TPR) repeat protein